MTENWAFYTDCLGISPRRTIIIGKLLFTNNAIKFHYYDINKFPSPEKVKCLQKRDVKFIESFIKISEKYEGDDILNLTKFKRWRRGSAEYRISHFSVGCKTLYVHFSYYNFRFNLTVGDFLKYFKPVKDELVS